MILRGVSSMGAVGANYYGVDLEDFKNNLSKSFQVSFFTVSNAKTMIDIRSEKSRVTPGTHHNLEFLTQPLILLDTLQ